MIRIREKFARSPLASIPLNENVLVLCICGPAETTLRGFSCTPRASGPQGVLADQRYPPAKVYYQRPAGTLPHLRRRSSPDVRHTTVQYSRTVKWFSCIHLAAVPQGIQDSP